MSPGAIMPDSPKAVSHSKPKVNGQTNGFTNGEAEEHNNGYTNGESTSAHINGHSAPGVTRRPRLNSKRHSSSHPIEPYGTYQSSPGGPQGRSSAKIRSYSEDVKCKTFPRLSKPVELLRHSYDCVVIGSGYGGGVAASRMARAGESVCLLERGKERWPGEYPSETTEAVEQVHYSGEFAPGWLPSRLVNGGDPTGMYHLIFGRGQNAVVCNGLGGTSLMNANVFMEADKETLTMDIWPEEIRNDPHALDQYYKKAEQVLEPTEYPPDWPELPKLNMLKKQAKALNMGDKFKRVRQTTRFLNGPNRTGVQMTASSLTGQDGTGLNDCSKQTTLVTYLADAWNWGAEMFCECEVRYIKKCDDPERGGYIIYFAWHGRNRGHFKANLHGDLMWVHAKKAVFLGAGSIATTEILLRSQQMGLSLSPQVGQNMSGNGDILAFGYNTDEEVNAIGRTHPSQKHPVGPCITGVIDNRTGHPSVLDGYVIEEGTIPKALSPFLQAMLELLPGSQEPEGENIIQRTQARLARAGSWFLGPYFRKGAIERTQVYLIMSHDANQAILHLKDDKPVLEFVGVGRNDHVKQLHKVLKAATQAVGGTFVQNPFFALMGKQQVTVHPIGGACLSNDGTGYSGATNHWGEVFSGTGRETHHGLIVTDAALIPTALGANPFATITALAERALDIYATREGLTIDMRRNGLLNLLGNPQFARENKEKWCNNDDDFRKEEQSVLYAGTMIRNAKRMNDAGFGFTEVMSGFIHKSNGLKSDNQETYELAERTAKSLCEHARFFLSAQSFNTRSIVNEPDHKAMLTGTFVCPTIPGSPFMVQRGDFELFPLDAKAPGTRNLTYDFNMRGVNGEKLHFHGYKVVDSSVALSPVNFWRSTSTLYVTVTRRDADEDCSETSEASENPGLAGEVVAKGIMRIQPRDFVSQMMTMTPTGSSLLKKAFSAANFLTYFGRKSLSLFLSPLTPLQYPSPTYTGYMNDTPPTESIKILASDNVTTTMHMWEPTSGADLAKKNLFMIPGASVDHQIYALPTIRYNAVNYFRRAGYRVFVSVHRIGETRVAQDNWTTYDARLDLAACLKYIRQEYGKEKVYCIAHCMGSVAFSTGLLDGTIPGSWISGITCSQVFMNPIWNTMNMIKAMAGPVPLDKAYNLLAGSWFSCSTGSDDHLIQRALNQLLRFMPDERRELCNNASCHRTTLVFGRCWNHRNLNEATHRQIDRFFGGVNMTLLHLLMKQGMEGHVMGNGPLYERLDTEENIQRLKGIPIMLFVGRDNAVLSPEATMRTYEVLTDTFGTTLNDGDGLQYRRRVVPDYGHLDCWMGRKAWKDVYPFVREEVDRVVRGTDYKFEDFEPNDEFKRWTEDGTLVY